MNWHVPVGDFLLCFVKNTKLWLYTPSRPFFVLFREMWFMHTHTRTHAHTRAHVHTRIHTHAHMHTHTCTHTHAHTRTHTHAHTCTRTHAHTHSFCSPIDQQLSGGCGALHTESRISPGALPSPVCCGCQKGLTLEASQLPDPSEGQA